MKDDRGFMWITTQNGLNRFDGKNIEIYATTVKNPKHRLQNNEILSITTDNQGRILLRNRSHFELIDSNTGDIVETKTIVDAIHFTKKDETNPTYEGVIVYKSTDNNIYCISGFTQELLKWDGLGSISFHPIMPIYKNIFPYSLIDDKDGNLWLLFNGFASQVGPKYSAKGITLENEWEIKQTIKADKNNTGYEMELFKGIYGIDCSNYQYINPITGLLEKGITSKVNFIYPTFFKMGNQFLWLSSNNIVYQIDTNLKQISRLRITKSTDWLSNNNNLVLYYTAPSTLWMGDFKGFRIINLKHVPFQKIFYNANANEGVNYSMRGISEDTKGNIVAMGNHSMLSFDTHQQEDDTHFSIREPKDIGDPSTFYIDSMNHYWTCNSSYSMNRIKLSAKSFSIDKQQFYNHRVLAFTGNNSHQLWSGGYELGMVDTIKHTFKRHPFSEVLATKEYKDKIIFFIRYASDSSIWVGGLNWLYRIPHPERFTTGNWTRYAPNEKGTKQIPSGDITEIREDSKHNIWVGIRGGGLVKINPKGDVVLRLSENEGLSNNTIAGILEADNGDIWISTFNGLNQYIPTSQKIKNYYMKDGLTHYEFNIHSAYKSRSGTLYFGGLNGISSINPTQQLYQKDDTFTHKMAFTHIQWFSEKKDTLVAISNLKDLHQSIELGANDRFLSIQFALLNFNNSVNNYYSYKIDELSTKWIELGHQSELQLPYLSSGDYTIHVRGRQADGAWNSEELTLTIKVKQVFYKTWWFWALLSLGIMSFVLFGYRYELRQLKKLQILRTKIASDLHDEVGSLLTRLSMQAEMVQFLPFEKAQKMLNDIALTSKNSIEYMRDIIWSIDARNDTIQDLLNRMEEHLSLIFTQANIEYHLDTTAVQSQAVLLPDIRQNVFLIFKEATHNIVKHSATQFVQISIVYTQQELSLTIKENHPNKEYSVKEKPSTTTGNGLYYMKMRAERIDAFLQIDRENGYTLVLRKRLKKKLL